MSKHSRKSFKYAYNKPEMKYSHTRVTQISQTNYCAVWQVMYLSISDSIHKTLSLRVIQLFPGGPLPPHQRPPRSQSHNLHGKHNTHKHSCEDAHLHTQRQTAQITQLRGDGNHLIRRDKAQLGKIFHLMCRDSLAL